ncbi:MULTISPECIES: hypothetical protein [unclassified Microbacterium]|uniref:hypothetical protein n=1 Tax=unclassified Microbacterium TaxID=2609290 RepID=UPI0028830DE5|nr:MULTISPECIES: hypothetical protein [unclassified Microbacterium]
MADEKKGPATRESVDAWFADRLEANRRARETKVTPEALLRDLGERREARSDRPRSAMWRAVPAILGCGFLLAAGAVALGTNGATQTYESEHASYLQQIATAEVALDEVALLEPGTPEAAAAPAIDAQFAAAEEAGRAVADLQQSYAEILFAGNDEIADDNGPQKAYENALAHQSTLAPFFADRTFKADRGDSLSDTDIDPRFPWYIGYASDGVTILAPSTSSWALTAVAPTDTVGVLEVTWLNRGGSGELYAWATSDYYVSENKFGDLTVGKTTLGDQSATELQLSRK